MRNPFEYFLVLCSGANMDIINKCPRSESIKHAGIGGTIIITSVLALFSGSYALFTVFKNYPAAIAFGVIWALMIFNLDRLIVSSMRKRGTIWQQFKMAIPRILLALIIAMVISKPLEIKLLETKIQKELFEQGKEKTSALSQECVDIRDDYDKRIGVLDAKMAQKEQEKPLILQEYEQDKSELELQKKKLEPVIYSRNKKYYQGIKQIDQQIVELQNDVITEEELLDLKIKKLKSSKKQLNRNIAKNKNPIYRLDKEIRAIDTKIDEEFKIYKTDIATLKTDVLQEKAVLQTERDEKIKDCQAQAEKGGTIYNDNSLPDLIVALSTAGDKNRIVSLISLFIMLLFIIVETVPILVKLISPRGPYDELLDAMEHKYYVQALDEINEENRTLNKKIALLTSIDDDEVVREVSNNKAVLKTISDAHHVLIQDQVNQWLEEERKKLRNNPMHNGMNGTNSN